ncbi:MAG: hypothetical protein U9Q24_03625 [Candidatus Ratteibacteria bacterium]|nr:hypothetical protein [Candidatus Ratteibacteria bacterium]
MTPHVIPKDRMAVRIYTENFIIEGIAYLPKGGRLSDYINVDRRFIPITEAVVRSLADGKEIQKMEILMLNRNFVIVILPQEEEIVRREQGNNEEAP